MLNLFGLILVCFTLTLIVIYTYDYNEGKFDKACPRDTKQGITVYILPVKYCGTYGQPC